MPITSAKQVSSLVEKFREKYGVGDVKKYYSKFEVAVPAQPLIEPVRLAVLLRGPCGHVRQLQGKRSWRNPCYS
jgi:hypothetical protein